MNTAYLLIGGNLGNRLSYLQKARELVQQFCGNIVLSSSIYETEAWGVTDQPSFFNQALAIETMLPPAKLMQELLRIEEKMGRERTLKMGPRIIDLDILLIDELIISSDLLKLPHPSLPERRFALLPLAEIAAGIKHPVSGKTIAELLAECTDMLDVQKKSATGD